MTTEQIGRITRAIEELHAALSDTDPTGETMAATYDMSDPTATDVLAACNELLHVNMEIVIWVRCWMAITWGAYRGRGKALRIAWQKVRAQR